MILVVETEFVEETGVRRLIIVYEKGDKKTKGNFPRDLVLPFTSEKTRTLTANDSTEAELFEPRASPTVAYTYTGVSSFPTPAVLLY